MQSLNEDWKDEEGKGVGVEEMNWHRTSGKECWCGSRKVGSVVVHRVVEGEFWEPEVLEGEWVRGEEREK